jgi:hypothetical protein
MDIDRLAQPGGLRVGVMAGLAYLDTLGVLSDTDAPLVAAVVRLADALETAAADGHGASAALCAEKLTRVWGELVDRATVGGVVPDAFGGGPVRFDYDEA